MERQVLKQEILDAIKSDSMLFGKVGAELKISPASLPRLLYSKDNRLTQVQVLKILSDHLKNNDLLETISEPGNNNNSNIPHLQEL